jgi:hypothetical protein
MTRLHCSAHIGAARQGTAPTTDATHQSYSIAPADRDIREAEKRVKEQEAHVLRLIVQGAPTQSAEDVLRQLAAVAEAMKRQRGCR